MRWGCDGEDGSPLSVVMVRILPVHPLEDGIVIQPVVGVVTA